jgi:hypothetical protein
MRTSSTRALLGTLFRGRPAFFLVAFQTPAESITAAKHVFRHGDLGIRLLLDTERAADLVDNVLVGGRDAAANGLLADGIGALPAPAPGKSL